MQKLIMRLIYVATLVVLFILLAQSLAYGQETEVQEEEGEEHESSVAGVMSPWVGIFALGFFAGAVLQAKSSLTSSRKIIPALSLAVGVIHLLLIQEHMMEAFEWGVFFTVVGIAQVAYGFIFLKIQNSSIYYIGAIGNAIVIAIYIFVRTVTAPFAPEPGPISEIDVAGIVADIIEGALVVLLIRYLHSGRLQKKIEHAPKR